MISSSNGPRRWHWLVELLPALVLIVLRWNAGPGRDVEDYAQYVLHARNIVAGRPYEDIGCLRSGYNVFQCPEHSQHERPSRVVAPSLPPVSAT